MPKGGDTKLAYKVSFVENELKIVFFGLTASGSVLTPSAAVAKLGKGVPFVYITCRNDVRDEVIKLWAERDAQKVEVAQEA